MLINFTPTPTPQKMHWYCNKHILYCKYRLQLVAIVICEWYSFANQQTNLLHESKIADGILMNIWFTQLTSMALF